MYLCFFCIQPCLTLSDAHIHTHTHTHTQTHARTHTHTLFLCAFFSLFVFAFYPFLTWLLPRFYIRYSTVQYLAERIDIISPLRLVPPESADVGDSKQAIAAYQWSAFSICESWAEQRGCVNITSGYIIISCNSTICLLLCRSRC